MVELRVRNEGEDVLVYALKSASEASEIIQFISDFFPDASYLLQPLAH